jgi:hypothetical protein
MIRLPLLFIVTGMISFVFYHVLSLLSFGTWVLEPPRNPDGWFRIHLMILDGASMIAMGAVYQLIDVVLQQRIYSRLLGYIHYILFAGGSIILLTGFLNAKTAWIAAGGVLALVGIILFAWNVGRTLLKAKQWNPITISTACSIGYLVLAGSLGMMMGLNFAFNWWGALHERMLAAHIWIGMLGWFGLLITGFSYKMLPMFYLSHGASPQPQLVVMYLWNAGVLLGALSFLMNLGVFCTGLSVLFLLGALIVYDYHLDDIRKHRHKASPGKGIWWTVLCTRALILYAVWMVGVWIASPDYMWSSSFVLQSGFMFLWGWVTMTILGYMSKIVPFLWWTHKYGPLAGKPNVPMMSDLIKEKHVGFGMGGMAAGLILTLVGIGFQLPIWIGSGISLLSLFAMYYMSLIARVFTR